MSSWWNRRVLIFGVVCVVSLGGATAYAVSDLDRYRDRVAEAPPLDKAAAESFTGQPRIVFRNTAIGPDYGLVATVSLADPGGPRAVTDLSCERIDVVATGGSCLQSEAGIVTRYRWLDLDADLDVVDDNPLLGMPSRTRLSPDGSLVASTIFVAGHSYSEVGFSTATVVREVDGDGDGDNWGNLEKFRLVLDGKEVRPADRNVWGVTFDPKGTGFYATVATGGSPYLVRGDLAERTLTTIRPGAECPALSPDGSKIAYKLDIGKGEVHWAIAVLDLATNTERVLDLETHSVDDQVQWLDDETLLYALPRDDDPGVTDVWSMPTDGSAEPVVLIEQAWSPAVVS